MQRILDYVANRLKNRKSVIVFNAEIGRVWPESRVEIEAKAKRMQAIREFAADNGLSVSIIDCASEFRSAGYLLRREPSAVPAQLVKHSSFWKGEPPGSRRVRITRRPELSSEDQAWLRKQATSAVAPRRLVERCQIILRAAQGETKRLAK